MKRRLCWIIVSHFTDIIDIAPWSSVLPNHFPTALLVWSRHQVLTILQHPRYTDTKASCGLLLLSSRDKLRYLSVLESSILQSGTLQISCGYDGPHFHEQRKNDKHSLDNEVQSRNSTVMLQSIIVSRLSKTQLTLVPDTILTHTQGCILVIVATLMAWSSLQCLCVTETLSEKAKQVLSSWLMRTRYTLTLYSHCLPHTMFLPSLSDRDPH